MARMLRTGARAKADRETPSSRRFEIPRARALCGARAGAISSDFDGSDPLLKQIFGLSRRTLSPLHKLLREETSLPITVAERPLETVAMGSGKALDNLDLLKEIVIH